MFLSPSHPVNAYELATHVNITQKAIGQADNYAFFVDNFQINGDDSIVEGSQREDDYITFQPPPTVLVRFRHHFYDPTNGNGLINPVCYTFFLLAGGCRPSLEWGFNYADNSYSWTKAREYMYIALTGKNFSGDIVAATADERNKKFQLMYRSVGQVMHLVEDLASPAHVRNDIHGKFPAIGIGGFDLYESFLADSEKR